MKGRGMLSFRSRVDGVREVVDFVGVVEAEGDWKSFRRWYDLRTRLDFELERREKRRMSSFGELWEARYEEARMRAENCFRRGVVGTEVAGLVVDAVVGSERGLTDGPIAAASTSSTVHAPLIGSSRSTRVSSASV